MEAWLCCRRGAPAEPTQSLTVDPSLMETIQEEAEKEMDLRRQTERAAEDRQETGGGGQWPSSVLTDRGRFSDDMFYTNVMTGDDARMDSMDSADSIDLSATPGSVSEEEGRTVANV